MRNFRIFLIFLFVFCGFACKKEAAPESLEEYVKRAGLTATLTYDPRGFYYNILDPGAGSSPTLSSRVTVQYIGTLTNGSVFDQSNPANPATFNLNQLILGWQYGIPLIKTGGRIMLYLPPSLGYGAQAVGTIPGNSVLIFDVTLKSFQ